MSLKLYWGSMEEPLYEFEGWLRNCIKDAKHKLGLTEEDIIWGLMQAQTSEMLKILRNIRSKKSNSGSLNNHLIILE